MAKAPDKTGLWLVGACGGVGGTVALGLTALAQRSAPQTGLVSALPPFARLGLVDPASLILGGHEVREETLHEAVQGLHTRAGLFDEALIARCAPHLQRIQKNIRPGTLHGAPAVTRKMADAAVRDASPAAAIERLSADIAGFRKRHGLARVVVVFVASSEPPLAAGALPDDDTALNRLLSRRSGGGLPPSCLYALAAIEAGCPFVNFTPAPGITPPVIQRRAQDRALPYMGSDGKTGETLIKSVLAPMFAMRHLRVLSWVGQNILGNRDGAVLADPAVRAAKINSKDRVISAVLGYPAHTGVSIDYVPSLDDWKVAWDYVHFEGFLGTRMSLQWSWCGSDSVLAAPLVIDLARFAAFEHARGGSGPMRHLACFFKDPIGVDTHDYPTQWRMLLEYAGAATEGPDSPAAARPRRRPRR